MKKITFLAITAILISCGNNNSKKENNDAQGETTTQTTQAEISNANETIIELNSDDRMMFDKSEIRVKAGQKIKLTLHHIGKLPETAMGHNFVLLKQGTDIPTFGAEAMQAADNQYIPKNSNAVIAHTDMIGGGESSTITFDAPAIGTYDFICSFPGHFAMMKGKFIVE